MSAIYLNSMYLMWFNLPQHSFQTCSVVGFCFVSTEQLLKAVEFPKSAAKSHLGDHLRQYCFQLSEMCYLSQYIQWLFLLAKGDKLCLLQAEYPEG